MPQESISSCSNLSLDQQSGKVVPVKIINHRNVVKEVKIFNQNNKEVIEQEKQEIIFIPNDSDILRGRGYVVGHHIGNVKFRKLVKEYQPKYSNLSAPNKKSAMVMMSV